MKYIVDNYSQIRIATSVGGRKMFFRLNKELEDLQAKGVEVTAAALAERLGIEDEDAVARARVFLNNRMISYDTRPGQLTTKDVTKNPDETPEETVAREEVILFVKKNLREILPRLNHREKIILKNYFLKDQPDAYTVIGKELDLSRERIRNLKDALAIKLQKFFLRQQGPQDVPLDEEF